MIRAILGTRSAQAILFAGLIGVGATAWAGTRLVQSAHTGDCSVHKHRELDIKELIAVKKRFMAYRKAPDHGMRLTDEELAMLVEDQTGSPVFLEIDGESFHAEVALAKHGDHCWPIDVTGSFTIRDGRAFVLPDELQIGQVELTPFVQGLHIELLPEHMPNARTANLLQKTRAAAVIDGTLQVELRDPNASLFTND